MTKIDLIVSDVEGCLMPANRSSVKNESLSAISNYCKAAQNNSELPPLILCTGRQIPYAEAVIQIIDAFFPGVPSIVENGAFLYDAAKNKVIYNPVLTEQKLEALREIKEYLEPLLAKLDTQKEFGKEVCISLNPLSNKSVSQLFNEVRDHLEEWAEEIEITHSASAVDITPKGLNKASGVKFLAEYAEIETVNMLGIGDTQGDLSMLALVGIPTAPKNATKEVQDNVKYVASQPETDGVIEIIRRFTNWK